MVLTPILLGLSGHKQSGKDTVYKFINDIIPITHKSFGENLKIVAAALLNCDYRDFESEKFKSSESIIRKNDTEYYTNREILQLLGTDICRSISPTIWIDTLFCNFNPSCRWIVTDVRFPNEAQAIKDRGGKLIRIERNTGLVDRHLSETALDNFKDWDIIIDNNSTLKDLKINVNCCMKKYFKNIIYE